MKNKELVLPIKTKSLCPSCGAVIDAVMEERGGAVLIRKSCSEHGDFELPAHDDAGFYLECLSSRSQVPQEFLECDISGCLGCGRHKEQIKTIMIDVTERCNLNCPACFTNTHSMEKRDPTIVEIRERLAEWKTRPTVLVCGGEPTLREDLPELIREITSLGFVVKIASNGIKLCDRDYVRKLKDAGLGWVLLQFDGFSDEIYRLTRGREMKAVKDRTIENLSEAGIKICLAFMAVKGINDSEFGRLIDFMMDNDHIMHIGCTVLADVGRDDMGLEYSTTALDVLRAMERETGGKIAIDDFMRTRNIGDRLYKLTGNRDFQVKTCFHTMLLHKRPGGYLPVNRYFSPGGAMRNLGGLLRLALLYGSLRRWDAISTTGKVKLITVEEFRHHDTVDLVDANRCNKAYMTENGYIPPCIYNTKYRPSCWLPADAAEK
jgi:uncharacterized radical SAM superfamily Fe-S cluster-containing enzyme